jgi:hypothetical protein
MNANPCLLEPTLTQNDTAFFEISTGPATSEERLLHVDYCYFLDGGSHMERRAVRTIAELVDLYIDRSRRIIGTELQPHPVRNSNKDPLNSEDFSEFKTRLLGKDGQRYHLSFDS